MSRGAWIAELSGLALVILVQPGTRRIALWFGIGALAAIALFVFAVSAPEDPWVLHIESIASNTQFGSGQINRSEQRQDGIQDILAHPVLGKGLGRAGYVAVWFQDSQPATGTAVADNWYIKTWQESGAFGFVCFGIFSVSVFFQGYRKLRPPAVVQHRSAAVGVWAAAVGYTLQGFGSNMWDFYMANALFWMLIGSFNNLVDLPPVTELYYHPRPGIVQANAAQCSL